MRMSEEASTTEGDGLRRLTWQAERFLYREADLLDTRRYEEWLLTLDEDLVYFMPILRNARYTELARREATREGTDIHWMEEGKWTLAKRVEQIRTGVHWAEEPQSRVAHMVSNVYVVSAGEIGGSDEMTVSSRFLVSQNRNQHETMSFRGRRLDVLRRHADGWKLRRREITLNENVLSAKMITTFF